MYMYQTKIYNILKLFLVSVYLPVASGSGVSMAPTDSERGVAVARSVCTHTTTSPSPSTAGNCGAVKSTETTRVCV